MQSNIGIGCYSFLKCTPKHIRPYIGLIKRLLLLNLIAELINRLRMTRITGNLLFISQS